MSGRTVLVTGFASFEGVDSNMSWEGVKEMNKAQIEADFNISFFSACLNVEYTYIDRELPKLWEEYKPDLMIHVGVTNNTDRFRLETTAHKSGYSHEDNTYSVNYENPIEGNQTISTSLDVKAICDEFNLQEDLKAEVSEDAGRFVCEYTFYTSLCHGTTLFVHVPVRTDIYTAEQVAQGLTRILQLCLEQIPVSCLETCLDCCTIL